jgi:hypothetical protein
VLKSGGKHTNRFVGIWKTATGEQQQDVLKDKVPGTLFAAFLF